MKIFKNPPKKPQDNEIFIDDVNELVERMYPYSENQHPLFKKFGQRIDYNWEKTEDWKLLDEANKWKYVAFCALYWMKMLEFWDEKREYQEYKQHLIELSKENSYYLEILSQLCNQENNEGIDE